ncbi:DUF485 domain-containing protein [Corynebacterium epidermidicanis]|uniref:Putative membrane protein n=1 Tax=Corynebacterium epidermidicanis TaxID=1050174 RepID=A0A0G3GPT4_9CORY|nr:DUF485 domain-containing protein [Corynebacterium epidermidicanis]AKK02600.1 putative membrane protein [Corynebacterium epidermidicanis]
MQQQHPVHPQPPTADEFLAVSQSEEFGALRHTFRSFAFPISAVFLLWFVFYIVVATFATDFTSIRVYGAINIGMVLGLAQFATAGIVTWLYVRFADNTLDPATASIRNSMLQQPTPIGKV